jgi:hypothetical protein
MLTVIVLSVFAKSHYILLSVSVLRVIMLSVLVVTVVLPSVLMLRFVLLIVVAPQNAFKEIQQNGSYFKDTARNTVKKGRINIPLASSFELKLKFYFFV